MKRNAAADDRYQERLNRLLMVSAEDLEENRAGRLGPSQARALLRHSWRTVLAYLFYLLAGLGLGAMFGWRAWPRLLAGEVLTLQTDHWLGLGAALLVVVVVGGYAARKLLLIIGPMVTGAFGSVLSLAGVLQVRQETDAENLVSWSLLIDGQEFEADHLQRAGLLAVLCAGQRHRVYYLRGARHVIAVEHLGP